VVPTLTRLVCGRGLALGLVLGLALVLVLGLAGRAEAAAERGGECTLTIAWRQLEPYAYRSPGGKLTGLDLELAEAALHQLGCRTRIAPAPVRGGADAWERQGAELLVGGDLDAGVEPSPLAVWSQPYRREAVRVLVGAGTDLRYRGETLAASVSNGTTVAVPAHLARLEELAPLFDDPLLRHRLQVIRGTSRSVRMVRHALVDALLVTELRLPVLQQRFGNLRFLTTLPLVVAPLTVRFQLSRRLVDSGVAERLNRVLATPEFRRSADALYRRYGGKEGGAALPRAEE